MAKQKITPLTTEMAMRHNFQLNAAILNNAVQFRRAIDHIKSFDLKLAIRTLGQAAHDMERVCLAVAKERGYQAAKKTARYRKAKRGRR